jgi:hypothetical protein
VTYFGPCSVAVITGHSYKRCVLQARRPNPSSILGTGTRLSFLVYGAIETCWFVSMRTLYERWSSDNQFLYFLLHPSSRTLPKLGSLLSRVPKFEDLPEEKKMAGKQLVEKIVAESRVAVFSKSYCPCK